MFLLKYDDIISPLLPFIPTHPKMDLPPTQIHVLSFLNVVTVYTFKWIQTQCNLLSPFDIMYYTCFQSWPEPQLLSYQNLKKPVGFQMRSKLKENIDYLLISILTYLWIQKISEVDNSV